MDKPLSLDAGIDLAPFQIAYQTYGTLNAERSNAVLIYHALTGDQHVANVHPVTQKPGWWETMVGPRRPIDTERYFVICPNVVGGCMGTTGPASTNPKTGMPWGLDFPVITIRDMDASFGAEHRLPRGRPAGGDGRPGMAARALFRRGHEPAAGARRRAHGQPHHISLRRGLAPQIWSSIPRPRQSDVLLRRRLSSGELSAPPGH